jgi:hypothetical protein
MTRRGSTVTCVAGLAALVLGCGGPSSLPVPVSGEVTLRGQPLPSDAKAFISFVTPGPEAKAVSALITGGKYDCPTAPRGAVTVFFEVTKPLGPPRKSDRTGELFQETQSLVPARYATGVPLTIDGPTTKDFDLID